jgi:hydroxyethylthiazole kinase-like sugar kinase family protein
VTLTGIDASALADGSLTISATSTDLVGNVSTARTTTVTKDTVVSAPTATYVDNSNPAADQITGTTEANATITANQTQPSASGPYTATAAANGSYTVALAKIKNQNVTYTVTATDAAGNTSAQTSVSFNDTK